MKLREETANKLKVFLGSLPWPMALRLAEAVAADRAAGGAGLPHDLILEGLSPALARAEKARPPEASRTESLLAELEAHGVAIRLARHSDFDVDALIGHVAAFATLVADLAKESDPSLEQRLQKYRAAFAETMEGFMARAPRAVLAALPTLTAGAFAGGPRVPDVVDAPNADRSGAALRYARLVAGCRDIASGDLSAALAKTQDELVAHLRSYNENLLHELRAAEGTRRRHAELYFSFAVRLASLLLGAEAGETLRRRALAETGTAA